MKFVRKIPSSDVYIDDRLVVEYIAEATPEDIRALERKKNSDINCGQKRVKQLDRDEEFIAEYVSITAASKMSGTDKAGIRRCCNGDYYTSGGYIWQWA